MDLNMAIFNLDNVTFAIFIVAIFDVNIDTLDYALIDIIKVAAVSLSPDATGDTAANEYTKDKHYAGNHSGDKALASTFFTKEVGHELAEDDKTKYSGKY